MDERRVTRSDVMVALNEVYEDSMPYSQLREELLNELFPPPPSEYEKAIDNMNLFDTECRRELWNTAIDVCIKRQHALPMTEHCLYRYKVK